MEQKQRDKNNFWIIDPIDGTTNFLHGIPHFCISLAYVMVKKLFLGLYLTQLKNELFYAEKNNGAFYNNQRIRVSKKKL